MHKRGARAVERHFNRNRFLRRKKFVFRENEMSSPPAWWKADKHSWFIRALRPNRTVRFDSSVRAPRTLALSFRRFFLFLLPLRFLSLAPSPILSLILAPLGSACVYVDMRDFVRANPPSTLGLSFWPCTAPVRERAGQRTCTYVCTCPGTHHIRVRRWGWRTRGFWDGRRRARGFFPIS